MDAFKSLEILDEFGIQNCSQFAFENYPSRLLLTVDEMFNLDDFVMRILQVLIKLDFSESLILIRAKQFVFGDSFPFGVEFLLRNFEFVTMIFLPGHL